MRKIIYGATLLLIASSCSLYSTFKTPTPTDENVCGEVVDLRDSLSAIPSWKEMFTDQPLQELIEKGLSENTDLRIARLNIDQAEASLRASKLAYLPSFALTPEASISNVGNANTYSYNLPLTMQWELDLFGRIRNSKEQARASMLQTQAYATMVQTQLVASIANTYYTLVMLDEQLRITQSCVRAQKENLNAIIALKEAGMQNETAVNQATANYMEVQSSAIDMTKQVRLVENSLALLINEPPRTIRRSTFATSQSLFPELKSEISLQALANRPDVKEAEYSLRNSFYGVNVARSAFYPAITLGGSVGWTNNLGMIANPGALLLSAFGSLTQPIFNRGVNQANLKIAKIRYEQSLLTFHKTILTAGNEVNSAMAECESSRNKQALRAAQVEANRSAFDNSRELMKHSSSTYLEVLIAESTLLMAELAQVSDWFEGVQGTVNLYKALGGGIE